MSSQLPYQASESPQWQNQPQVDTSPDSDQHPPPQPAAENPQQPGYVVQQPYPQQPFPGQQAFQGQQSQQTFPGQQIPQFSSGAQWSQSSQLQQTTQPAPGKVWPQTQAYPPQQPPQAPQARRGLSRGMTILLIALAVVLMLGGGGLIYYWVAFHPAQLHMQTTTPQSIYNQATSGTPALNDPLTGSTASNWRVYSINGSTCAFTGGALHATGGSECDYLASNFSNFAYQVKMTILTGNTEGGLSFRTDNNSDKAYTFGVGTDGTYDLYAFPKGNENGKVLSSGKSSAIATGLNQSNLLTVIALGSTIYLYVNKHYLAKASDNTSSSGGIGVFEVEANSGTDSDVAFNDAQVWNL